MHQRQSKRNNSGKSRLTFGEHSQVECNQRPVTLLHQAESGADSRRHSSRYRQHDDDLQQRISCSESSFCQDQMAPLAHAPVPTCLNIPIPNSGMGFAVEHVSSTPSNPNHNPFQSYINTAESAKHYRRSRERRSNKGSDFVCSQTVSSALSQPSMTVTGHQQNNNDFINALPRPGLSPGKELREAVKMGYIPLDRIGIDGISKQDIKEEIKRHVLEALESARALQQSSSRHGSPEKHVSRPSTSVSVIQEQVAEIQKEHSRQHTQVE